AVIPLEAETMRRAARMRSVATSRHGVRAEPPRRLVVVASELGTFPIGIRAQKGVPFGLSASKAAFFSLVGPGYGGFRACQTLPFSICKGRCRPGVVSRVFAVIRRAGTSERCSSQNRPIACLARVRESLASCHEYSNDCFIFPTCPRRLGCRHPRRHRHRRGSGGGDLVPDPQSAPEGRAE